MAILILSSIYGTIVGLVWSLALAINLSKCALTGAAIGASIGLIAAMLAYGVQLRGRLTEREVHLFWGSVLSIPAFLGVISGLLAWLVRIVLF